MRQIIFIVSLFILAVSCTNKTSEKEKTNIDSSNIILNDSNATCYQGKGPWEIDSFYLFKQYVYPFSEKSKILASSISGDTLIIVDEYYEDGACDGPSYHVKLISFNKKEDILIHKLECNTQNTFNTFIEQEDTLIKFFKQYKMRPIYDSIIQLGREKISEKFNIYDSFSTYESDGITYIKTFSINKGNTKLLTISYNDERKILNVTITGAIFFRTSKHVLIQYNEKQEWETGDTEGFSNYKYFLIGT